MTIVKFARKQASGSSVSERAIWALSWSILAAVIALSLWPRPPLPDDLLSADKLLHAVAYGALVRSFLLAAVWRPGRGAGRFPMSAPYLILAAIGAGVVIEAFQALVSTRSAEVADAFANCIGVGVGSAAWSALRSRYGRQRSGPADPSGG